jgi:glycopeptide antibiotics resistance protein
MLLKYVHRKSTFPRLFQWTLLSVLVKTKCGLSNNVFQWYADMFTKSVGVLFSNACGQGYVLIVSLNDIFHRKHGK